MRPIIYTHSSLNTYRFHTDYQRQIKDSFIFINIFKTFLKPFFNHFPYHIIPKALSSSVVTPLHILYRFNTHSMFDLSRLSDSILFLRVTHQPYVDVIPDLGIIYIYRQAHLYLRSSVSESTTLPLCIRHST